jgi:hypothetical protein
VAVNNPALQMCAVPGCPEVGTGQPRSRRHCGPHYRSEVLAGVELTRCDVIGQFPVVDARTGEDIPPGGVVELDPVATQIPALIAGGFVRIAQAPAAVKAEKKV